MRATKPPKSHVAPYRYALLGLILLLALVLLYLTHPAWPSPLAAPDKPVAPLPCASTDMSYCALLRRLVAGVTADDFSLLLTTQPAVAVTCSGPTLDPHCAGNVGRTLDLYLTTQNGASVTLTHNEYITYFRSLVARDGAFRFASASCLAQACTLVFTARLVTLSLPLTHGTSGWVLNPPVLQLSS